MFDCSFFFPIRVDRRSALSSSNPKSFMAKSITPFERSLHTTRKSTQDNQVTRQHLQQHEQERATLAGSTDAPLREESLCSLKIVSSRRVNFLRISTLLDVSWERCLFCTSWSRYRTFPYTFRLCVRQFSSCNVSVLLDIPSFNFTVGRPIEFQCWAVSLEDYLYANSLSIAS